MEYDKTKADEIAAKYNIGKATVATWKHRNIIPDKYLSGVVEVQETADNKDFKKVVAALGYGKFRKAALARHAGIKHSRFMDLLRDKTKPSLPELIALKKAINGSRNAIKHFLTEVNKRTAILPSAEKKFKEIMDDENLVFFKIIGQDREIYAQLDGWKRDKRDTFPNSELNKISSYFLIFLTETSI